MWMDVDISLDIHAKYVDMDMDVDGKFYIHGNRNPGYPVYDCCNLHMHNEIDFRLGFKLSYTFGDCQCQCQK